MRTLDTVGPATCYEPRFRRTFIRCELLKKLRERNTLARTTSVP